MHLPAADSGALGMVHFGEANKQWGRCSLVRHTADAVCNVLKGAPAVRLVVGGANAQAGGLRHVAFHAPIDAD